MTRKVLITRHPSDCLELRQKLAGSDIVLRPFPVLRAETVEDDSGWDKVQAAGPPDWLVLTSPRAPSPFVEQARCRDLQHLLDLPIAAVGETTAQSALKAGLQIEIEGPGSGKGLAAALLPHLTPSSLMILACGHDRRREIPEELEGAGHRILPIVVYRMRPTPPRELPPLGDRVDAVVLTSPRAARLYLDGVGGLPLPCQHWALGPTTRDAAGALGIDCNIPEKPTMNSLAEELCRI
jgi:uroporphyrinogen-III synthase